MFLIIVRQSYTKTEFGTCDQTPTTKKQFADGYKLATKQTYFYYRYIINKSFLQD